MSKFRDDETVDGKGSAIPNDTALFLIRDSVAKRKRLIYGTLENAKGEHCAMGAFWEDNPGACINADLLDEVAAVNDSLPPTATPHQRWKKVNSWLRFKIATLTRKAA